jgi:lipopolysaccharide/colanic/teichoic acid biosynthesis glycosyltransferase
MANFNNQAEAVKAGSYYAKTDLLIDPANQRIYLAVKIVMDILGSSLGIFFGLPLLILITILIKLEEPRGPVFFKQQRVGKGGKPFYMYKFRSMVTNSEEMLPGLLSKNEINGAMFKMKDDPRITKVGKVLRRLSLDELPQLWNVLKNDMSLVGPRPALPWEVEQYSVNDAQRLLVAPGCTGLWQVSGRSGLSFDQMVELDLHYIRKRTVWLDVVLIFRTIHVMITSDNAY